MRLVGLGHVSGKDRLTPSPMTQLFNICLIYTEQELGDHQAREWVRKLVDQIGLATINEAVDQLVDIPLNCLFVGLEPFRSERRGSELALRRVLRRIGHDHALRLIPLAG